MLNSGRSPASKLRWIGAVLSGSLVVACAGEFLWAQAAASYVELPYDPVLMTVDAATNVKKLDDKKVKQLQQIKNNVLVGSVPFAENQVNFERWYKGYQFRAFTQLDQLQKLPERRREVVEDLRRARAREVRENLLKTTRQYMEGFAVATKYNFHPAVRYNAVLLIGELNKDEISPQQRLPNPLPEALGFLVNEFKKPNQTDAIRLASLLGILRHVQLNWGRPAADRIPNPQRQEIARLMLDLIAADSPPAGRSREGHIWMQRRALDVLGSLGAVGSDTVNKAIVRIVRDHDAELSLRLTAAATLGRMPVKPPANSSLDPAAEARYLGALLVQSCQKELERIEEYQKRGQTGGDPYGMGMGMAGGVPGMGGMPGDATMGGMPGMAGMPGDPAMGGLPGGEMMGMGMGMGYGGGPKDPQVDLYRRRLKYELLCVEQGLAGIKRLAAGKPALESVITRIEKEIEPIKKASDPPPMAQSLLAFHKTIKDSLLRLENTTASVMPKKPVVAEADEEKDAGKDTANDEKGTVKKDDADKGAAPQGSLPAMAAAKPSADEPTLPASVINGAAKSPPAKSPAAKSAPPAARPAVPGTGLPAAAPAPGK